MDPLWLVTVGYLLTINLLGLVYVGYDKKMARLQRRRIPEKRFFIIAFFGGAVGVIGGMRAFRHKTRHTTFVYGMPLMLMLNIIFCYLLLKYNKLAFMERLDTLLQ